jgi:hypothetical protein
MRIEFLPRTCPPSSRSAGLRRGGRERSELSPASINLLQGTFDKTALPMTGQGLYSIV